MIKPSSKPMSSLESNIYAGLLSQLEELKKELKELEQFYAHQLQQVHPQHLADAINLVHYIGLRRRDVRPLQKSLAAVGLSSLGRMESHVFPHLNAITDLLGCVLGKNSIDNISFPSPEATGMAQLEGNTHALFGKAPFHRRVRIMVTLPDEAAHDYELVKDMLINGMDCARINCAHDTPEVWARMIEKIHHASRETGKQCRILMDLGGPKLRTGEIAPGPAVLKWKPRRDNYGKVVAPARIWLYPEEDTAAIPDGADASVPIQGNWLATVKSRDLIKFTDARGSNRIVRVTDPIGSGFWAESNQTAYLMSGIELWLLPAARSGRVQGVKRAGVVGKLPASPQSIRLHVGDHLTITRESMPGLPAQFDQQGHLLHPVRIACTLPDVFHTVRPGERVLIDDGRIGGVIRSVNANSMSIEITEAKKGGEKLLAGKGINLPDSRLELKGLTTGDLQDLEFIIRHADMIGLSFVRNPADIRILQKYLRRRKAEKLGIVMKIETRAAFENLPELLFTLLQSSNVGVMIARGDLAVECGYERLAELQEEILWLAEGAHLPVIWATQVLEGLSKSGKPSRAEISDAAMGVRAECVMLNKGPHIIKAIRSLDDILHRMQSHQHKKNTLLRQLHW